MSVFSIFASVLAITTAADAAALLNYGNEETIIPGSYIVALKDGTSSFDFDSHVTWATNTRHANMAKRGVNIDGLELYNISSWQGYGGSFDDETLNELLKNEHVLKITAVHHAGISLMA